MNTTYTYSQIANSYALWTEYADTDGIISRDQFDTMNEDALVEMMINMFGAEPTVIDAGVNYGTITRISIAEDGVWATDAAYSSTQGWQDGAQLSSDADTDDEIYAAIRTAIRAGETAGEVEAGERTYTWTTL